MVYSLTGSWGEENTANIGVLQPPPFKLLGFGWKWRQRHGVGVGGGWFEIIFYTNELIIHLGYILYFHLQVAVIHLVHTPCSV